jgi:hypothetical protein
MNNLEYCAVVRDLDQIIRGMWLRDRGNIVRSRKETVLLYSRSKGFYAQKKISVNLV